MKILILSLLICFVASFSVDTGDVWHKPLEEKQLAMNVKDILQKLKDKIGSTVEIDFNGKKLKLTNYGTDSSEGVPVHLYGENGVETIETKSTHQRFYDEANRATFTVSTFYDKNGETPLQQHLRGSIVDGKELIEVKPHPKSISKRSVDDDYVLVYKRSHDAVKPPIPIDESSILGRRNKRQTSMLYSFIETLVVCDFSCYSQHAGYAKSATKEVIANYIEGYLAHAMHLADLYYQRSFEKDTQLKINLYSTAYVILTTATASKFTTDSSVFMTVNAKSKDEMGRQYVNGDVSLAKFNDWLMEQIEGKLIPSFDIAVAFVNSNLFTPSSDLLGIAPMSGACTLGRNGVLVEDSGEYSSGSTTAHEIAHNIAVDHDVNANNAACLDNHNFVMSTSNKFENRVNSFYFSSCSINSLKSSFITKKMFACTLNSASRSADYTRFTGYIPGQILNADEQCKRAKGSASKLMLGNKAGGGSFEGDMCSVLWCTTDYNSASAVGYAAEGTSCGDGKWCSKGVCTVDSRAPKGTCLVEDDTAFCNDFLAKYGMTNVCNNFKTGRCCKMCGGTLIPRMANHDIATFVKTNSLNDVHFLDNVYNPPCVDKEVWCSQVPGWLRSGATVCSGGYTVNDIPIHSACKQTCALC